MKLYDNAAKRSFERDPRGLLHLTRSLPLDVQAEVTPVEREIAAPQMSFDTGYLIRAGTAWIEMVEALARWHSREVRRIADRANLLSHMPHHRKLPIRIKVALLTPEGVPRELPERFEVRRGDAGHWAIPRYFRLWEEDPAPVLALGRPALMPWVPLMKSPTTGQLKAAADAVAGDAELVAQFYTLGSVHYERGFLRTLLERFDDMFTPELVAQTPAGKEYGALMKRRGRKEGRAEGSLAARLDDIREFLKSRYPRMRIPKLEDRFQTPEAARDALRLLYRASTAAEARAILAPPPNGSH